MIVGTLDQAWRDRTITTHVVERTGVQRGTPAPNHPEHPPGDYDSGAGVASGLSFSTI